MTPQQRDAYKTGNEAARMGMPRVPPFDADHNYQLYWEAGYDGEMLLACLAKHIAGMGRSKGLDYLNFMGRKRHSGKEWQKGAWYVDMKERVMDLWRKKR